MSRKVVVGVDQVVVALHLNICYREELEQEEGEGEEDDGIWPDQHKRIKLEASLWQNLPTDFLFNSILVRLSFPCLLRLHTVSRSWRSRLSSSPFWCSWFRYSLNRSSNSNFSTEFQQTIQNTIFRSSLATQGLSSCSTNGNLWVLDTILRCGRFSNPHLPYLLLCTASPHVSLNGLARRWVKHKSVNFIRSQSVNSQESMPYFRWLYLHDSFLKVQKPYSLLACEKGLLLFALHGAQFKVLVVCNPLLQKQRVLPMPNCPLVISSARFFVDGESGDYSVILPDCSQSYHSRRGKWQEIQQMLHVDKKRVVPPLVDGSMFWLQQLCESGDLVLAAYHPEEELVTRMQTRFPSGLSIPKHGVVWKDSQSLQTVAVESTCLSVLKLEDGIWKEVRKVAAAIQDFSEVSYLKLGNLVLLKHADYFQVFHCDLERGAWTPRCPLVQQLKGYCTYQPSHFEV
ncbi:hypothetical protein L7F22_044514 [Adiantum nelumboides]|nr:hypothetical protein [Adiantum nelumboides]